jgi:hypothetical protein
MLPVSENGTGFGLLPLMLVLIGLPAFWGAHAGGTYRTRAAELVRPAAHRAVPTGAKRRNPALLELPAPDASGTRLAR